MWRWAIDAKNVRLHDESDVWDDGHVRNGYLFV